MGIVLEGVAFSATNPGAGGAAATMATGDSASIRNFTGGAKAYLEALVRQGASEGFIEVRSPRFHDNTRGIHIIASETPTVRLLATEIEQPVYPADTLTLTLSGGAAEVDGGVAIFYYEDVPGMAAQLKDAASIEAAAVNIHPVEVDFSTAATAMAWQSTSLTATQNLMKANKYYALIGYTVDVAVAAIGLQGPETGNARLVGPGPTSSLPTTDYFIRQARITGRPYVPVINANNRNNLNCVASAVATATAVKAELIFLELADSYAP